MSFLTESKPTPDLLSNISIKVFLFIFSGLPNLFTVDEETKIMKKLDHKFEKATVTEEDHEVEAEVEAEVVPEE